MASALPLVFPDTNVFLAVIPREPGTSEISSALLLSSAHKICTSELVRLETISHLWRHDRKRIGTVERAGLVADAGDFFSGGTTRQPILPEIIAAAFTITYQVRGIHAMDALHAAVCRAGTQGEVAASWWSRRRGVRARAGVTGGAFSLASSPLSGYRPTWTLVTPEPVFGEQDR